MGKKICFNNRNPNDNFYTLCEDVIETTDGDTYRLIEQMRLGGNSVIFKCENELDGIEYALKLLSRKKIEAGLTRFEEEIRILEDLKSVPENNEHNIEIKGSGHTAGTDENGKTLSIPFYVMDLAERSLWQLLNDKKKTGGIDYKQYSSQFRGLASALSSLHKLDICHRDIKPENILVMEDDGKWLLADYGLCSRFKLQVKKEEDNIGPKHWMSPEAHNRSSLKSKEPITTASDVYQLASIFWFVIHHRHPIGIVTRKDWKLEGKDSLFFLLQRCLHHQQSARPQNGQEFFEHLEIALQHST